MRPLVLLFGLVPLFSRVMAEEHVVEKFDGTTAKTTPTFTVSDKWEVVWQSPAPVRITLLASDGTIVAGTAGLFHGAFYQPKGGTYYLQVDGLMSGRMPPWHLSVVELGDGPSAPRTMGPEMSFTPPAVLPPAGNSATTGAAGPPAAAPATSPPASAAMTEAQTDAVVMVEGDNGEGTGFLVKMPDGPCVVTNLHVVAANPHLHILTNKGLEVTVLGMKGATDRDLALFQIQDNGYSYLEIDPNVSGNVQPGDDVITPGNSQGGEVVLSTHGGVTAVGPQRIEFTNPIYHGNSGGPIFHTKTGQVIGVVTEAIKVDTGNDLDKASFDNHNSAITSSMRYFGLRLDTVPKWEVYDFNRYLTESTFLQQFREQSRRLDSYLNSAAENDANADDSADGEGPPSSKLYLTDDKIVKAHETFLSQSDGGDASQRLDACRNWLLAVESVADANVDEIQNPNNFYQFDQQRARDELAYRQALRQELESFSDDIGRIQSLAHKN